MKQTKHFLCSLMAVLFILLLLAGCATEPVLPSEQPSDLPTESEAPDEPQEPIEAERPNDCEQPFEPEPEPEPETETETQTTETTYILNTSSKKYHIPSCHHVKRIAQKNYDEYVGTADALQGMGYTACGTCH